MTQLDNLPLEYYPVAISNGDVIYDVQLNNVEEDNSADNWALFQVTNLRVSFTKNE